MDISETPTESLASLQCVDMKLILTREYRGFPVMVRVPTLCNARALANHGQTLERLNERGGVTPAELIAIVDDTKYFPKSVEECAAWFSKRVVRKH